MRLGSSLLCLFLATLAFGQSHAALGTPYAVLDGPKFSLPGSVESFSGKASFDLDGRIVRYDFRCGDESQSNDTGLAQFRLPQSGRVQVFLTVTDDAGRQATAELPVTVGSRREQWDVLASGRQRRGAVMLLCERGDPATAEAIEATGEAIFAPTMALAYEDVVILKGEEATPQAFFDAIRQVASRREAVDVFLYAHGSPKTLHLKRDSVIRNQDLVRELKGRGGERVRMVYSTLCFGETMNQAWLEAGARAVSGAVNVHMPIDALPFMLGWLAGEEYGSLMGKSVKFNDAIHDARNALVAANKPLLLQLKTSLGKSPAERVIGFYLDWVLEDDAWQIWKSHMVIEGQGTTIHSFDGPVVQP